MKKINKNRFLTIGIILVIILISYFSLTKSTPETDEEIVKCIGEKATLYGQDGCPHCINQEKIFGNNSIYLNIIDCTASPEKCVGIKGTPSWSIKGKEYLGVQSIIKLQELTGC